MVLTKNAHPVLIHLKKKGGGGRWLIVQSVFTVWASDILPVLFLDWRET